MGKTILYIATSFDGFIAGPNDEVDWMSRYDNVDYGFKEFLAGVGAIVMGRGSYDIGVKEDWFGKYNYGAPIVVITSRHPDTASTDGDFTFVTEGIEAAHRQATTKAGDKNVWVFGGASIAQQYAQAGLLDEIELGLIPIILGDGKRLFERTGKQIELRLLTAKQFDQSLMMLRYAVH